MSLLPHEIAEKIAILGGFDLAVNMNLNNKYVITKIKNNIKCKALSSYDNLYIYILRECSIYDIEFLLNDSFYITDFKKLLRQPPIHLCNDIFDYLIINKEYQKLEYFKNNLNMKLMITVRYCDEDDIHFIKNKLGLIEFLFHFIGVKQEDRLNL
jgi:hypothetical protein